MFCLFIRKRLIHLEKEREGEMIESARTRVCAFLHLCVRARPSVCEFVCPCVSHACVSASLHLCRARMPYSMHLFVCCGVDSEESLWSGWNFPAWCSGGRRPFIAECLSLQHLGLHLPVTRPVWDSNLGPPASESGSSATVLSLQLHAMLHACTHACMHP